MPKFNILIVDDVPKDVEPLFNYLSKLDFVGHLSVANDVYDAAKILKNEQVDIVFMDVEMPEATGIELYDSLPHHQRPALVLVTAHEQFAVQGFRLDAADYILKPVTYKDVIVALEKVFRQMKISVKLETDVERRYSWFNIGKAQYRLVAFRDIIYVEAAKNYITIRTRNMEIKTRYTMKELEREMPKSYIMRVHSGYIVNLGFVEEMLDNMIVLREPLGKTIPFSRNYRKALIEKIAGNWK